MYESKDASRDDPVEMKVLVLCARVRQMSDLIWNMHYRGEMETV